MTIVNNLIANAFLTFEIIKLIKKQVKVFVTMSNYCLYETIEQMKTTVITKIWSDLFA